MRENRPKRALRKGEVIIGLLLFIPSPELVEIMSQAGFDFVIIDFEHGSFGIDSAKSCVLAADAANIAPIIRVADNQSTLIEQALDLGAQGVVVPHVNTVEEATRAVRAAKYPPAGNRGYCPVARGGGYGKYGFGPEYTEQANEETMVILLIEDVAAMENIEAILSVEGVDVVFPGPGDMAASMGLVGQFDHEAVRSNMELVVATAKKRGLAAATTPFSYDDARYWVSKGAHMIAFSTDSSIFYNACQRIRKRLGQAVLGT